ncbi:MAG TPA: hypothetical protein VGR06_42870 [Actinophytocola sp.]|jgi:hypothetical protein|nr:hypothetical protein [Actinophytocola sp.]
MRTARAKLLAYALALAVVFAAAWTLGAVIGPGTSVPTPTAPAGNPHGH